MVVSVLGRAPRILPLYARAVAATIPGACHLERVPGEGGEIPEHRLLLRGVRADARKLAAYCQLCGFPAATNLPGTYPYVLALPLHLMLLTDGGFPFAPVGLIHIENRIIQRRAIPLSEEIDLAVHATAAKPHPRGIAFSLITEARVGHESVWQSTSTMLKRSEAAGHTPAESRGADPGIHERTSGEAQSAWSMPKDLGRRYATVSGDRNPIHTHALLARSLGFRGAIAHGMWMKARALAELGGELAEAYGMEASFRRPVVLPAVVHLTSRQAGGETEFALREAERCTAHMRGRVWAMHSGHDPAGANAA